MAVTNTNINIRVDSDVKAKAQDVFSALGLDMTSAINIFLRQAIRKNGIPFELIADQPRKTPKFGYMKDKIWEADDHDWFEPNMTTREQIITQLNALPDNALEKVAEHILFQKYSLGLFDNDSEYLASIPGLVDKIKAAAAEPLEDGVDVPEADVNA
jgi:addiction module RelB/DinJ family antitoxin